MLEYLDPVVKAEQCAQCVDIGVAANSTEQVTTYFRAVFEGIQNARLKLSMAKCHFGTKEVDFRGRTITLNGVTLRNLRITEFMQKVKFPRSKKQYNVTLVS